MGDNWYKGVVSFNVNGKPVKFNIWNNMPNIPGLRLSDAVTNWLARTDDLTPASLCNYIDSKDTGYRVYTQEQWDEIFTENEQKNMEGK